MNVFLFGCAVFFAVAAIVMLLDKFASSGSSNATKKVGDPCYVSVEATKLVTGLAEKRNLSENRFTDHSQDNRHIVAILGQPNQTSARFYAATYAPHLMMWATMAPDD